MRTGHSLTGCRSLLSGGCLLWGVSAPGEVSAWGAVCFGGVSAQGVSAPEVSALGGCLLRGLGVCSGGCLLQGGVCCRGCLLWGGMSGSIGEADSMQWGRHHLLWTEWQTGKNITLATTSLRPVKIKMVTLSVWVKEPFIYKKRTFHTYYHSAQNRAVVMPSLAWGKLLLN